MKKFLAIILSLVMVLGLLTGCGGSAPAASSTTPASSDPAPADAEPQKTESETPAESKPSLEGYKLGGIDLTATGMTTFLTANTTLKDMCATLGAEYVPAPLPGYDDAGFMAAYESLIEQGCNGIMVYTFSEGPIALIADMLENREKYARKIDETYHDYVFNIGISGKVCARYILKSLGKI